MALEGFDISEEDLATLGYTRRWLDYGFLRPDFFKEQIADFRSGVDSDTEHYRFATFTRLLQRPLFTVVDFERYIELADADPDLLMGRSALISLLMHPGLTDAQFEAMCAHPRMVEYPKPAKQQRLRRDLRRIGPTPEVLQRCLEEGDKSMHRRLLEMPDVPRSIVEAIAQVGTSSAVRNSALTLLRSKRFRESRNRN